MDMVLGNVDKKDRKKYLTLDALQEYLLMNVDSISIKCIGFDINPYSKRFNYIENLF